MAWLEVRLDCAKDDHERDAIREKIRIISPWEPNPNCGSPESTGCGTSPAGEAFPSSPVHSVLTTSLPTIPIMEDRKKLASSGPSSFFGTAGPFGPPAMSHVSVFLSSTGRDLAEHRAAVARTIDHLDGFRCVRMEGFGARDAQADDFCRREVAECDVFVAILGHVHGSCPPGSEQSYTEREYEAAVAAGIARLVFLAPDDFPLPAQLIEPDEKRGRQAAFRERVGKERVLARFDSPEDLAGKVMQALFHWQQGQPRRVPAPGLAEKGQQTIAGPTPACPYRGLFAFQERDAPLFFGRDGFTARFAEAVRTKPLVVVIGPSGCGKSSVVFAGLLPRLRAQGGWLPIVLRPGDRPCYNLAAALVPVLAPGLGETERLLEAARLGQVLNQAQVALGDVIARSLEANPGTRVLLIVDQLEELFTLCRDPLERHRFLMHLLGAALALTPRRSPSWTVVLTLRADFLGQALEADPVSSDSSLADLLVPGLLLLGPMTRAELREAVERPAQACGARIEDGLTERILDALEGRPGSLPLLEFALTLMWQRQRGGVLTHAVYDAVGTVERALADYASEVYAGLDDEDQRRARRVFVQLVSPGVGTEDTRRRASHTELRAADWELVEHLATRRLVVTTRDPASGDQMVEIAHEALIRAWGELRHWLEADHSFRTWQERLRAALRAWEAADKADEALLWGTHLAEAERWLRQRPDDVSAAEQAFIQASRRRREKEEEANKERERILEQRTHDAEQRAHDLERLALTDPLTGLCDRRAIEELARFELRRRARYPGALSLGLIDIDHFKRINEEYLLPGGDQVIVELARILTISLREVDSVGRVGGEEFMVIARETGEEGASSLAERIRATVAETAIEYNGRPIHITVSIGFAVADLAAPGYYPHMMETATAALAWAKANGRNRCEVRRISTSQAR
jgi:diguanylate cyclase (GGDEF)-like protein